jgi:hypothetical protein
VDNIRTQYICRLFPNGEIREEQWGYDPINVENHRGDYEYIVRWHRLDGPAHIVYNKLGDITRYKWWINGELITSDILEKYFVDALSPTDEEIFLFKMAKV